MFFFFFELTGVNYAYIEAGISILFHGEGQGCLITLFVHVLETK